MIQVYSVIFHLPMSLSTFRYLEMSNALCKCLQIMFLRMKKKEYAFK